MAGETFVMQESTAPEAILFIQFSCNSSIATPEQLNPSNVGPKQLSVAALTSI